MITRKKIPQAFITISLLAIVIGGLFFMMSRERSILSIKNTSLIREQSVFSGEEKVFTYGDKTFVTHDAKPIDVTIYTSSSCVTCAPEVEKVVRKIKNSVPTVDEVVIKDIEESENKTEALEKTIAYVPSVVFPAEITATEFYTEGSSFFRERSDGSYQFYTHALGHTPQLYIASPKNTPSFSSDTTGATSAKSSLEIHAFLTADCASCKTAHDALGVLAKSNPTIPIIRHFSQNLQEKESLATRAIACAAAQKKEDAYVNNLFARQAAWKAVSDLKPVLVRYATAQGIDAGVFETCLTAESSGVETQDHLFNAFGITSVPTIFVGDQSFVGVQKIPTLQKAITDQITPRTKPQ